MFIKTLNFIWIPKEFIPPEYREVLDHKESTTLRLEDLYRQEMYIKILKEGVSDMVYKREIVMLGKRDHIPRELAHIEILLENLPDKSIRREIIEQKRPFGKVLVDSKIETAREGMVFFKVYKEERISKHLDNPGGVYYGRKYSIWLLPEKKKLAEVIEIYSVRRRVSM